MGGIKDTIRSGANSAMAQIKSMNVDTAINSKLNSAGINFQIPNMEVPETLKNMEFKTDGLKVPDASKIVDPVKTRVTSAVSSINLPSEIGGFEIPKIPDMSEITTKANNYLKDTGFSLKSDISFDDIKKVVSKGDITSIINFDMMSQSPIDMHSIEAVGNGTITSLDSFDLSETQREMDELTKEFGIDSIDIYQYF